MSFLFLFVLSFSFINTFFLEKYFTFSKRSEFINSFNAINKTYEGLENINTEEVEKAALQMVNKVIIFDKNLKIIFDSKYLNHVNKNSTPPKKPSNKLNEIFSDNKISIAKEEGFRKYITENNMLKSKKEIFMIDKYNSFHKELILIKKLSNGDFCALFQSIDSSIKTTLILNNFTIKLSILLTFFAALPLYLFSKRLTKPIIKLSKIAEDISEQNFENKFTSFRSDEIGELGDSINMIAENLEDSLNHLKSVVQRKNDVDNMRKNFVNNISKELKKPIKLINQFIQKIDKSDIKNRTFDKNDLENIINETDKMDSLIKNMLDISYFESGVVKINKSNTSMNQIISEIIKKYDEFFAENKINFTYSTIKNSELFADKDQITQALVILIENSIQQCDNNKILDIKTESFNSRIRVSIYYSGKNIPEADTEKIWMTYHNSIENSAVKNNYSRLELAIAKAIIENHEGYCGIENLEKGVKFYFVI